MKKRLFISVILLSFFLRSFTQEFPLVREQQLENESAVAGETTEDDSWQLEMESLKENPVSINTAGMAELSQLRLLNEAQISNLLRYRSLFGPFIHPAELQAVPGFDPALIRQLWPYITIDYRKPIAEKFRERLRDGQHSLLVRMSARLEKSAGYRDEGQGRLYQGNALKMMVRYRYQFKNLLQWGWLGDKDAGERFFRAPRRYGFDFYSAHLFVRKLGFVQALALGDFTVNLGQGLAHWQGLAFRKSAEATNIERQSAVLRPYQSAGEFYFLRGAGITLSRHNWELTLFASVRRLSANLRHDSLSGIAVSSFITGGLNRTKAEQEKRNVVGQQQAGGAIYYRSGKFTGGVYGVYYRFSMPVSKRGEPYNLYAWGGTRWFNAGIDYRYSLGTLHLFGELAVDLHKAPALVQGLLFCPDPRVDISLLYRKISAAYQAPNGNAFTEGSYPSNETGLYAGIVIRPLTGFSFSAYADLYRFPWLKYLVDAPSGGRDYLAQLSYRPSRRTELYIRYRDERKQVNARTALNGMHYLAVLPRKSWRAHWQVQSGSSWIFRNRVEWIGHDGEGPEAEQGFLLLADVLYKPMLRPFGAGFRLQYFETDGYSSRIYAYENDVAYQYSIPAFYDKGWRYYLNINVDWGKRFSAWIRFAQSLFPGKTEIGTGSDKTSGKTSSEWRVQGRWFF